MSQIHFGVMYDTETGEFSEVDLQSMPVNSGEWVWDDPYWRRPEGFEIAQAEAASQVIGTLLETANTIVREKIR